MTITKNDLSDIIKQQEYLIKILVEHNNLLVDSNKTLKETRDANVEIYKKESGELVDNYNKLLKKYSKAVKELEVFKKGKFWKNILTFYPFVLDNIKRDN